MEVIKYTFITMAFILNGCKENVQNKKNDREDVKVDTLKEIDIHDCTTVKDTIFKDHDYVKYISLKDKQYGIEIKINDVVDTLDYRFDCNVSNGSIPKLVFKDKILLLSHGAGFNYRYAVVCTLDRVSGKINTTEFETGIIDSSENDFLMFTESNLVYLFNRNNRELLRKSLPKEFHDLKIINSEILKGKIKLLFSENKSLEYAIKDFELKDQY